MSNRTPRLCIVTPTHWEAFTGGAQYQVKYLLDQMIPLHRHEIYFLGRRIPPDFEPEGYQIVRIGRSPVVPRMGFLADAGPLYRALRAIRPDVIYQRVGCGYTGIAAHYARRNRSRLVWHISHDTDVLPRALPGKTNSVRHFLEKRSIEYGIRHAHTIVAQTNYQARLLKTHYGRTVDAVIPNFHPDPEEVVDKSGPLTVLWVANLKPWKQPEVFVRLARALTGKTDARFVMIGASTSNPSNDEWHAQLMNSIDAVPNLEYLGPKTQQEVNSWMACSHLFVNTSREEGFANTFIQAWMRSVPVISLHVNPDDVLEREVIGTHAGTEGRLHEAVTELLRDATHRERIAVRAREYAIRKHSLRNVQLLQQLIDTGRVDECEHSEVTTAGASPMVKR